MGSRIHVKPALLVVALTLLAPSSGLADDALNLWEWSAMAPVIATGMSLGDNGNYTEVFIDQVLRGDLEPDQMIRVAVKRANRWRSEHSTSGKLRLEKGLPYALLLEPAPSKKRNPKHRTFELVRGVRGARELPAEGRGAYVAALATFIEVQDMKDDRLTWQHMNQLLQETNPIVVETALDQFLKFRRAEAEHLGIVRPLLDHPSELMRTYAVRVIGQIAQRQDTSLPDRDVLQSELVARARRDPAPEVRVAATEALNRLDGDSVEIVLEEIAEDDPDQDVRYAAEKMIYTRKLLKLERQQTDSRREAPSD